MEALQSGSADVSLIGQFGVGFYSAFLVADHVTVYSRHADSDGVYVWESSAGGTFTVGKAADGDERAADLLRGTRIFLHLKEGMADYADEAKVRGIIKTHSEYCVFPIYLWTKRPSAGEGVEEAPPADADEYSYERINKVKPVWMRKPDEVSDDEHTALFKSLSGDWEPPLATKHFEADGNVQFKAVIYVPRNSPIDLFQNKRKKNVKLYVKKVFVTDDADQLVPDWLNFVSGVVDSDDLPLNVSREMLQQNRIMGTIRKMLVKKCIEMLKDLSADPSRYGQMYKKFSKNLKLGVHEDAPNRDKIVDLLRFHTTGSSGSDFTDMTSLAEYVGRMREGQSDIYFLTAETLDMARKSPCLEKLVQKGYEVLLMVDPMDEYLMQVLREHDGKPFACCSRANLKIPGERDDIDLEIEHADLIAKVKDVLGESVQRVTVSTRLVASPCIIVSDVYGWTSNMERIVKMQTLRDSDDFMAQYMGSKRIFEINVDHPITKTFAERLAKDAKDAVARSLVTMAYRTSLISSGFPLDGPADYATKVFALLCAGVAGDDVTAAMAGDDVRPDADAPPEAGDEHGSMQDVD
jgi:molecular chaperone HtpG